VILEASCILVQPQRLNRVGLDRFGGVAVRKRLETIPTGANLVASCRLKGGCKPAVAAPQSGKLQTALALLGAL
jgi:hypothetical protein